MEQVTVRSLLQYRIENAVSNGLGYYPEFHCKSVNGEATEIDLIRHLGVMDQRVLCQGITQKFMEINNRYEGIIESCNDITRRVIREYREMAERQQEVVDVIDGSNLKLEGSLDRISEIIAS